MPRPAQSLKVLEMTGTLQNHRGRYADRVEPETKGPIGDPPESFKASSYGITLTQLWHKLVDEAPVGVLTVSDREYLESVCRIGAIAKTPGRGQQRALEQYGKMLKGLGMTPEGRAIRGLGGKAVKTEKVDPLGDFRKKRRRAI